MRIKNILPLLAFTTLSITAGISCENSKKNKFTNSVKNKKEISIESIKDSYYRQYQQQESIQAENLLKRDSILKIYQTKREQLRDSFNEKIKYLNNLKQKRVLTDNEYRAKASLVEQEFKINLLENIKQWCNNYSKIVDEMK